MAVVTAPSALTTEAILKSVTAVVQHARWRAGFNVLFDLRGVTSVPLHYDDVRDLLLRVQRLENGRGARRVAVVAADDVAYGTMRILSALGDGILTASLKVFRDVDAAESWLTGDGHE